MGAYIRILWRIAEHPINLIEESLAWYLAEQMRIQIEQRLAAQIIFPVK
jgi:hypothetical protein